MSSIDIEQCSKVLNKFDYHQTFYPAPVKIFFVIGRENNFEFVRLAPVTINTPPAGNTYLHNSATFSIIEQDGQTRVTC